MKYKIVVDSCCDLPEEYRRNEHFVIVPLTLTIENHDTVDDETFDQKAFIAEMKASPSCPKSSCPSPDKYRESFEGAEEVYVVTLSEQLSGSYNSAELGKKLYLEKYPERKVEVFNSRSASAGEVVLAQKIYEMAESGCDFEEVVKAVSDYRDKMETMFVLESLENLRKNGRLSNLSAFVATALNIKPLMGATREGTICKIDQARGINKALVKMAEEVKNRQRKPEEELLVVAHCNCKERAEYVKAEIEKRCSFKEIMIVPTAGVSSLYANDGGIVIAF